MQTIRNSAFGYFSLSARDIYFKNKLPKNEPLYDLSWHNAWVLPAIYFLVI